MPKTDISLDSLETRIFTVRGLSVLLDSDLAQLYGVDTKARLQAMRRNRNRFPQDFLFQLSNQEVEILRSVTAVDAIVHMRLPNKVSQCSPASCAAQ